MMQLITLLIIAFKPLAPLATQMATGSPYGSQHSLVKATTPYTKPATPKGIIIYTNSYCICTLGHPIEHSPPLHSQRGSVIISPQSSILDGHLVTHSITR